MVSAPVVPGLVLAFAPCILAESPRWLIMRGDMDGALAALHRVYSKRVRAFLIAWRHVVASMQGGPFGAQASRGTVWSAGRTNTVHGVH